MPTRWIRDRASFETAHWVFCFEYESVLVADALSNKRMGKATEICLSGYASNLGLKSLMRNIIGQANGLQALEGRGRRLKNDLRRACGCVSVSDIVISG